MNKLVKAKDKAKKALARVPRPSKRDLVAMAVGVVLGVGGVVVQPEEPASVIQNVAPIETGEGVLEAPRMYGPMLPVGSDLDQDGLANTIDSCPWNAGKLPRGCP